MDEENSEERLVNTDSEDTIRGRDGNLNSLALLQNLCCGCSLELSC